MISRHFDGERLVRFIAAIFSAGLALVVFSSCGRREADSGKRASLPTVSSSLATVPSTPLSPFAVEARSENAANVAPSTTGREEVVASQPDARMIAPKRDLPQPVPANNAAVSEQPQQVSGAGPHASQTKALLTPLVAVGFDPSKRLSAQQVQQAVRLAEDFLAATSGESEAASETSTQVASTADAASAAAKSAFDARWRSAQQKSDDQFKAWFGNDAFNVLQMRRAQQEYQDRQAGK